MLYYVKAVARLGLALAIGMMALVSVMEFSGNAETRGHATRGVLVGGLFLGCICAAIVVS